MGPRNGLQNKQVIVLGGSSGIVAEAATSQGAKVVIASSNAERVQKAIKSIGGQSQGQPVVVDRRNANESQELFR
jgi:NAD(P)-dependent dehydrogenase (short-subunit alcohol dehydrogenase family)